MTHDMMSILRINKAFREKQEREAAEGKGDQQGGDSGNGMEKNYRFFGGEERWCVKM